MAGHSGIKPIAMGGKKKKCHSGGNWSESQIDADYWITQILSFCFYRSANIVLPNRPLLSFRRKLFGGLLKSFLLNDKCKLDGRNKKRSPGNIARAPFFI
jgi:hypothetical protein